jgi:hypothetical protein
VIGNVVVRNGYSNNIPDESPVSRFSYIIKFLGALSPGKKVSTDNAMDSPEGS